MCVHVTHEEDIIRYKNLFSIHLDFDQISSEQCGQKNLNVFYDECNYIFLVRPNKNNN